MKGPKTELLCLEVHRWSVIGIFSRC